MELLNFLEKNPSKVDKRSLGYINEFYDRLFSPKQNEHCQILEIGISEGYSVMLWRDFFPNSIIHGIDINPGFEITNHDRIFQIIQDAYSPTCYDNLPNDFWDIVIDDGPHTFESMSIFLNKYLDKVKSGGYLILEDIVDTAWTNELKKIIDLTKCRSFEVIHMAGKQLDDSLKEKWRNGLDVIIIEKE